MNRRIKAGWVKKLRSGKFKQGLDALRQGKGAETEYCCLGVLTAMAVKNGVCPAKTAWHGNAGDQVLCSAVIKWAGLPNGNPDVFGKDEFITNLASLNDHAVSFAKIADIIEAQL